MPQIFSNAARTTLASGISDTDTVFTLTDGDSFPVANGTDWFKAVLQDEAGIEIVHVTTHTANSESVTVTRAQEGTTARSFAAGSAFGLRLTAGDFASAASGGLAAHLSLMNLGVI
jgi:hypothetical protein